MKSIVYSDAILAELDQKLSTKLEDAQVPGMSLIVAQDGEHIFEKYYGHRDVDQQLPVNADTIFGVASITKSFAALAIMQLEDAGKLSVEDKVTTWLPELTFPDATHQEKVLIKHLLSHTSGLPGMNAIGRARAQSIQNDPDGEYLFERDLLVGDKKVQTVVDLIEVMNHIDYSLISEPGNMFNYSNEGYGLLQEIVERASGESFINFIQKNIFDPLQMTRSVFLTEELEQLDNVTELYAYTKDAEKTVFHSPAWWDVGCIYANGSIKSTAADLIKYLDVYRLNGLVNGIRIVSEQSIKKMTSTQVIAPNGSEYGFGMQVDEQQGVKLTGHGGSIKGVSSNMVLAKEQGISVIVLTNIAEYAAEETALMAIKHILGLSEKEEPETDVSLSIEEMKEIAGIYESGEGQKLKVEIKDETLQLIAGHNQTSLQPYADNQLITADGRKISIIENANQEVTHLFTGVRLIPKTQ